jgi:type IV fimbrial biogenesis protein FimT
MPPSGNRSLAMNAHAPLPIRRASGFTLMELIYVVTIVGVLAAIAVPTFGGVMANARVKGAASDLHLALLTARSEAVRLDNSVQVRKLAGGGWEKGWEVVDAGGNVLESRVAPAGVTITTAAPASLTYRRSGRLDANLTPAFTLSAAKSSECRRVAVGVGGMPTVSKVACP